MRGQDARQAPMFSTVSLEERIPADRPLRAIRAMAGRALPALSPLFSKLYAAAGRHSIPPERLPRALPVQVPYSVCPERLVPRPEIAPLSRGASPLPTGAAIALPLSDWSLPYL